jgi:hypothetical protein
LSGALVTNLFVAGDVAVRDVGSALCFTNRAVLQHQVPEEPGLAVVAVWSQPLLEFMYPRADNPVCNRGAGRNHARLAVTPRRSIRKKFLRFRAVGGVDIVLHTADIRVRTIASERSVLEE